MNIVDTLWRHFAGHVIIILLHYDRVLTAGGNQNPATLLWNQSVSSENKQPKPNLNGADTFGESRSDGNMPAKLYIAEIFLPPYMFIDHGRGQPEIVGYIWNDAPNLFRIMNKNLN